MQVVPSAFLRGRYTNVRCRLIAVVPSTTPVVSVHRSCWAQVASYTTVVKVHHFRDDGTSRQPGPVVAGPFPEPRWTWGGAPSEMVLRLGSHT
eukprot:12411100-Karenia_brevis.AAC.1